MDVRFLKMQAAGNDFILIDEFGDEVIPEGRKESFVAKISDRHFGIGSDGVIFVRPAEGYDAEFVFYNPDGSRAEMCGNGLRCFVKYVYEKEIARKPILHIKTLAGPLVAEPFIVEGSVVEVSVDMGHPRVLRSEIPVNGPGDADFIAKPLEVEGTNYTVTAVGMGNPHAVLFVDSVAGAPVKELGRAIRQRTDVFPNGTNVHFVEEIGDNEFNIRTYERGVEDETLACGTGICASATAAVLNELADKRRPLIFHARGGDLSVEFELDEECISRIFLKGPVESVFNGVVDFP